jgi:hypothetical protein
MLLPVLACEPRCLIQVTVPIIPKLARASSNPSHPLSPRGTDLDLRRAAQFVDGYALIDLARNKGERLLV